MKEYFTYQTVTPGDVSRCVIVPKDMHNFPFSIKEGGSYHVAIARLLGLDYPTYLRFLRDSFPEHVTLTGKNQMYVYPVWHLCNELLAFIKMINKKMELTLVMAEEENNDTAEDNLADT